MATRLTFIAHARTESTRAPTFPFPETPALISGISPVSLRHEMCLRGPEVRCEDTAAALSWEPDIAEPLADLRAGRWTGMEPDRLLRDAAFGEFLSDPTVAAPGGESIADLTHRVTGFLKEKTWPDGRILLVAAPMTIRSAVVGLLDLPLTAFYRLDIEPLAAVVLSGDGRRWQLRGLLPHQAWTALWAR